MDGPGHEPFHLVGYRLEVPDPEDVIYAGERDEARPGYPFGHELGGLHGHRSVALDMQDERRNRNRRQNVAHVDLHDRLNQRSGHAGARGGARKHGEKPPLPFGHGRREDF